jgi:DNA-binding NarL/FixJ family response regulator
MSSSTVSVGQHRILIVDDHPVVRHGLALAIGHEPDLDVCGEAASTQEALRLVESDQPDVAIVDLALDGEDGIELIDYITSRWSSVKVLVYSSHDEEVYAGRVLRAGAMGYVSKRESMPTTVAAIRQILRGDVYLSPKMTANLLQRAVVGKPLEQDPVGTFSNRELQVFKLIGHGLSTVQIARQLELSPKTIESHRKVIKTKLNVRTLAQLRHRAYHWVQENR